jgi:quercetin 2,3-dioxygenase
MESVIMFTIRLANERGHGDHGWLNSYHTFSFADYHDPQHMGFRTLRVMNDDRVAAGHGFPTHGHRDMEIISYVLAGQLEHRDSLGHGAVLRPGEVQRISAGTGIRHSEFNPSTTELVHFYQIWIQPDRAGHAPSYAQREFAAAQRANRWQTIVSPDGRDGSLSIHQNATIHLADLAASAELAYGFASGRAGWLQVLRGNIGVNGRSLSTGDGVAIVDERDIRVHGDAASEVMLFDLN